MFGITPEYLTILFTSLTIFTISAQSFNVILGYAGIFHLGHIAFVGLGAYTTALMVTAGHSFLAAFLLSIVLTGVASAFIGVPTLKLREDYLVIATLGFGIIAHKFMENWEEVTNGPIGISDITRPELFGISFDGDGMFLLFCALVALVIHGTLYRILHSQWGKTLEAIREDEIAAETIGLNTFKYKLQSLIIGATCAGIAGSLGAYFTMFVSPSSFDLIQMIYILLMVVLGGAGNFWGAIIGATIITVVFEVFRFLTFIPPSMIGGLRIILFATTLILLMLLRPNGIMGKKIIGRNY